MADDVKRGASPIESVKDRNLAASTLGEDSGQAMIDLGGRGSHHDTPINRLKRLDSPSDAFKDVFEEYGAKLSPALRRLQIEGDLPFADGPGGDQDDDCNSDQEADSHN